jgi:hypothetical protein
MKAMLCLMPLALLAACDSGSDIKMENGSAAEVAGEMRKQNSAGFVNPGKWQQVVTLIDIEAPGMPAEAKTALRQAMGQTQTHEVCLTEAQAKSPREDFFTGADQNCRYETFEWGGGKIDLKLNCSHASARQTMVLTGDYQPNSYAMAMTATTKGSKPIEQMVMKMKVDARRVGACDAKDAAKG